MWTFGNAIGLVDPNNTMVALLAALVSLVDLVDASVVSSGVYKTSVTGY